MCGHPARLRAFSCITAFCYPYPYATTPHARALFRIHYEGCQVWSGLCWGHFGGGAIHPEMGRRNGALHPPRVSGPLQLRTLGFGYVLSMHMGMSGRPFPRTSEQRRVLGTSDQMTPPHTHTRTLRCTARSSTGFLLDCGAPTSMMHLRTKPGVIPSFLTVLRAEPICRRTENRFIETRRNEADSY